ncbi:MAG: twin-arginine translocase TatA/TatE family subunit [Proteobacteria bacterium]|nr:twin-arginine translocase TatA/TatE family subunit [Pseudomonadota bacterium]
MITPPALIGPPGPTELILILVIIMIFFGVGKLPEVGKALGSSIKAFKEAQKPDALDVTPATTDLEVTETEAETVTTS